MPEWETISHQAVVGGFVRDATQQPIANVVIMAREPDEAVIVASTRSCDDGSYFLMDIVTGSYLLSATYEGLRREVRADIPDFHHTDFRMMWLDFELPAKAV